MESNSSTKYIIGLGNPIVDISATSDEASLKKFGLAFGGTVFRNDENEGFFDVLEAQPDVTYIPGGSVTNSIRIANVNYS
jgi:adenosine kinase